MSKLSHRLDKIEKAVVIDHRPNQTIITRFHGEEAQEKEREFILTQARASLGLCEPSNVIFLSRRLGELREEHPRFPQGLTQADAQKLIREFEKEPCR